MEDRISAIYEITPQVESPERAFDLLLHEMTSGIQYFSGPDGAIMDKIVNHVPSVDRSVMGEIVAAEKGEDGSYRITFSIPASNLNPAMGGITNLWPIVAGEVFNFYFIRKARLLDLSLPESFQARYLGPRCGLQGMRELLHAGPGPLFGAIIKPNVGLNPAQAAKVVRSLADAGFDFIKDDEICVDPMLCPLRERVSRVAEALDASAGRSGRKPLYMSNITVDFASLHEAARIAAECGAGGFMVDPFCTGMSTIDFLRRTFPLPIYCHRVGYGLYSLGQTFSVSFELFSKLFRLLGADFSHVGGIWGSGADAKMKTGRYLEILRRRVAGALDRKETWPVVSGISLDNMEEYYRFYGDDTLFLEHIDIYTDTDAARRKIDALKRRVEAAKTGAKA